MTKPPPPDKSAAPSSASAGMRHVFGPRPVGALVPSLVRPAFRGRNAATAQVLADWESIVGPAIAAVTTPKKLFSGSLTVACSGPIALELQHLSGELLQRINAHFGKPTATTLRFVQDFSKPIPRARPPRPAAIAAARAAVANQPEDPLRDALEKLGRAVLSRPVSTPGGKTR